MRIEIYPKRDGMQHVNLMFCENRQDPEDLWVLARVDDFPVPPKRVFACERDGRQYKVLQFGQCVIAQSMYAIEKHKGIVDHIRRGCAEDLARSELTDGRRNELISQTALEFGKAARFAVNESGDLTVELDETGTRERLLQLVAKDSTAASEAHDGGC